MSSVKIHHFFESLAYIENISELEEAERHYLGSEVAPASPEAMRKESGSELNLVLGDLVAKAWKEYGFVGALVYGAQGVGKSVYCILVVKQVLDRLGWQATWEDVIDNYVVFRVDDLVKRLSGRRIPAITWDDAGVHGSSDMWFYDRKRAYLLGALYQTLRTKTAGFLFNTVSPNCITRKLREHGIYMIPVVKEDGTYSIAVGYRAKVLPNGRIIIRRVFTDRFRRWREWYPIYMKKREYYADEALRMLMEKAFSSKTRRKAGGGQGKRLTPEKIEKIKRMLEEGKTYRQIARELGVSQNTISKIKKEFTGKEVT